VCGHYTSSHFFTYSTKVRGLESVSETCVLNKNTTMDNVQKHNNCINIPSSQKFTSYSPFSSVYPSSVPKASSFDPETCHGRDPCQLLTRRPGFSPKLVHVSLVMDEVAVGYVFFECFGFPCRFSFGPVLHFSHPSAGSGTTVHLS
jgi:hypothetical protein